MKKLHWKRVVSLALAFVLIFAAVPVSAYAAFGQDAAAGARGGLSAVFAGLRAAWGRLFGAGGGYDYTLVEDESTVTPGTNLRGDTYEIRAAGDTTVLKYFPVTLYDYDTDTINNATHQVEVDQNSSLTQWNGIYFNGGSPASESYTYNVPPVSTALVTPTWDEVVNKGSNVTFYEDEACTRQVRISVTASKVSKTFAQLCTSRNTTRTGYYYYHQTDNAYYPLYARRTSSYNTYYYYWYYSKTDSASAVTSISSESVSSSAVSSKIPESVTPYEAPVYRLLSSTGSVLATLNGTNLSGSTGTQLYKKTFSTTTTGKLAYAGWNWWKKGSGNDNTFGQYTYSGLVQSTLAANGDIQFNKPQGGIFSSDTAVKNIYTEVDMPFVYENGTYTFDASKNGVYFHDDTDEDTDQGSTEAKSGGRLYFNKGNAQTNGGSYGDGSTTVWMPFNDATSIDGEANCNYHFGMKATIPFTMTANGRLKSTDDSSEAITFEFSGDDDVWVFVDGKLVIDLGGIHNRLDATINFATNEWEIVAKNGVSTAAADVNGAELSGKLFNDSEGDGVLGQSRDTFAAKDSHELTIFYLERGKGSSNCKIKFNLPMKDTLSVKKLVSDKDDQGEPLSPVVMESLNNRDFTFIAYRKDAGQSDFHVIANTNYNLLNQDGQYLETRTTGANGEFKLKNGQTAKFVGEILTAGSTFYVQEPKSTTSAQNYWANPTWTYTAKGANGVTQTDAAVPADGRSMTVEVKGSDEAEDYINFVCTNTYKHVEEASLNPADDTIVLDYGLSVEIDPLRNDTAVNGSLSLESVTGAKFGKAEIVNGKVVYTLNRQLTDVEDLTYTVKIQPTDNRKESFTATAHIYIIPATTMYYEESFAGLITKDASGGAKWSKEGTANGGRQEPGVVGTTGDSPYGSDALYLAEQGDSYGTVLHANVPAGYATFKYTFTGTGTTIFARMTQETAYIRVRIYKGESTTTDKLHSTIYRDTMILPPTDGSAGVETLYNVPVFDEQELDYGTYTVAVAIYPQGTPTGVTGGSGSKFYLDGIRVYKPMNMDASKNADNAARAATAYATDGESNCTVAQLRDKLLQEHTVSGENGEIVWDVEDGFVLFTDTKGELTTASEYKSIGPKNEVYLNKGQAITFSLANWDPNAGKLYLGMKAPQGAASVTVGSQTLVAVTNASDCYYDISQYGDITTSNDGTKVVTFTITAASDTIISLTNIKVTGIANFVIIPRKDIEIGGGEA